MLQPLKVATPPEAALGLAVQARVAPAGVVMASNTPEVSVVTVLPAASCTVTTGCVANPTVLAAPTGWVVKASLAAGPAPMIRVELTDEISDPSVAVRV